MKLYFKYFRNDKSTYHHFFGPVIYECAGFIHILMQHWKDIIPWKFFSPSLLLLSTFKKIISNIYIKQIQLRVFNNINAYHTGSIWCKWNWATRMRTYFTICLFQPIAFWRVRSSLESIGWPNFMYHGIPIFLLYPNGTIINAVNNIWGVQFWHSFSSSSCQLLVQRDPSFIFPNIPNNFFIFLRVGICFLSNTYDKSNNLQTTWTKHTGKTVSIQQYIIIYSWSSIWK